MHLACAPHSYHSHTLTPPHIEPNTSHLFPHTHTYMLTPPHAEPDASSLSQRPAPTPILTHHTPSHLTLTQNQVLLACADVQPSTGPPSHLPPPTLRPHFLLLPSHSVTLLVKPVLTSELLLPLDLPLSEEKPPQQAQEALKHSLGQVSYCGGGCCNYDKFQIGDNFWEVPNFVIQFKS